MTRQYNIIFTKALNSEDQLFNTDLYGHNLLKVKLVMRDHGKNITSYGPIGYRLSLT